MFYSHESFAILKLFVRMYRLLFFGGTTFFSFFRLMKTRLLGLVSLQFFFSTLKPEMIIDKSIESIKSDRLEYFTLRGFERHVTDGFGVQRRYVDENCKQMYTRGFSDQEFYSWNQGFSLHNMTIFQDSTTDFST